MAWAGTCPDTGIGEVRRKLVAARVSADPRGRCQKLRIAAHSTIAGSKVSQDRRRLPGSAAY